MRRAEARLKFCLLLWAYRWRLDVRWQLRLHAHIRPRSKNCAQAADRRPKSWIVLDAALHGRFGKRELGQGPTAQGCGGDMIVKSDRTIRPFKLVALVTNREIEMPAANRGG